MQNDQWSETHCHRQVAGNCHEFHQLLGSLHSTHDSDTSPKTMLTLITLSSKMFTDVDFLDPL